MIFLFFCWALLSSFQLNALDHNDSNRLYNSSSTLPEKQMLSLTRLQEATLEGFIGFDLFPNFDFDDEIHNFNFLSNLLNDSAQKEKNTTVAPFPLYFMLMMFFKDGSEEIKEEIRNFFPKPISVPKVLDLANKLIPQTKDNNSQTKLFSYLYVLSNKKLKRLPENLSFVSSGNIKQRMFEPNKESIAELNQLISDDHDGKLKGPLNDANIANTLTFLVNTLYVDTRWHTNFRSNKLLFTTKEGKKIVPSFIDKQILSYSQQEDFTIVHVQASDGIYMALKITPNGSDAVLPITIEDLNLPLNNSQVELEIPEFYIENSIDVKNQLKHLLPKTLDKDEENTFALDINQANELTVNKNGITISSVTKATLVARGGGLKKPIVVKFNKPFSYMVYKKVENNRVCLVNGTVWDPASTAQISLPNLDNFPIPQKTLEKNFFTLTNFLVKNISKSSGKETCICPLSLLIALNNVKNIFNAKNEIDNFLSTIGFELELNDQLIETLLDRFRTIGIKQTFLVNDEDKLSKAFMKHFMGLDDEMLSSIKWFLMELLPLLDNTMDNVVSDFSLIHPDESNIIDRITQEEWQSIKALNFKALNEHLRGDKNESITELSQRLLKRDDAKFLCFLRYFSQFKNIIKNPEENKKVIQASWFIIKNKHLLSKMSIEDISDSYPYEKTYKVDKIMDIFDLDKEHAEMLSEDELMNIPTITGIKASLASIVFNPAIGWGDQPTNAQDIRFGLIFYSALQIQCVEFMDHYTDGISTVVRGYYQENKDGKIIAIPTLGDHLLIMQDSPHQLPDYITYNGEGEETKFFLSMPLFEKNPSCYSVSIPWTKGTPLEVESKITVELFNFPEAKPLENSAQNTKVILDKPFRYAIAKRIKNDDRTNSYAILLTGINDGSSLKTYTRVDPPLKPLGEGKKVEGKLIIMNLASLTSLVGTIKPEFFAGKILILEDVNEPDYKIDPMLRQLRDAKILQKLKGIVLGQLSESKKKPRLQTKEFLPMWDELAPKVPIFNWPIFGHNTPNWPAFLDAQVVIEKSSDGHYNLYYQMMNEDQP